MSDVMKDGKARPPIDLDEFERQLREMQAQPKHPISDPLAELARIVGQDDPFRLAQGMRGAPARAASDAPPAQMRPAEPNFDDMLRGNRPDEAPASGDIRVPALHRPVYASPLDELAAISATQDAHQETGPPPDFLSVRHEAGEEQAGMLAGDEPYVYQEPQKRSRTGIAIFMGLVVFGLAGVGAVWSLSGPKKSAQLASADVPVIAPKPGPAKEKPSDPGGLDVPNQKTAVLEKVKDDLKAPSKVLAREEQPVDLSQAGKKDVRRVDLGQSSPTGAPPVTIVSVPTIPAAPATSPPSPSPSIPAPIASVPAAKAPDPVAKADSQQTASIAPQTQAPVVPSPPTKPVIAAQPDQSAPGPSVSAPKRVKSIRFNANGEPADTPNTPVVAQTPSSLPPIPPAATPAKPAIAVKATPVVAPAPKAQPKQVASRELVKESATPVPALTSDDAAPLKISPPSGVSRKVTAAAATTPAKRASKATQTALAAPATDDGATAEEPVGIASSTGQPNASRSTSSDGARKFSVQFGAPGSTGEADALIGKLKSQYPSVMGSVSPRIIKAEVNGKSFYRVRSGALSREEASSICTQLKSAGGACFISGA